MLIDSDDLQSNFEELLVTNKMMELDPETWAEMLKSDDIRVGSEVMLLCCSCC